MQDHNPKAKSNRPAPPAEAEPEAAAGPTEIPVETAAPAGATTPDELEQLRSEAAKAREYWDRLLRATADFENFKRRATRERQEASKYASGPVLRKLMPVLDSLDEAVAAARVADANAVESLQDGIRMIQDQLRQALTDAGLAEVDATGQPFDPNWHEAVSQQETDTVPEGHVLRQLRKGYKLHDRLLRPASVIVATRPAAETAAASPTPPERD